MVTALFSQQIIIIDVPRTQEEGAALALRSQRRSDQMENLMKGTKRVAPDLESHQLIQ